MSVEAKKIKSVTASTFSTYICYEMMGPDAMILVFWMLTFKSTFSPSSFTFIKRLFSSLLSFPLIQIVSLWFHNEILRNKTQYSFCMPQTTDLQLIILLYHACMLKILIEERGRKKPGRYWEEVEVDFKHLLHNGWDYPGGPVAKTLCFQCRGHGLDPWLWN